ncbi:MAG: FAD-dependent oxidoreductase [Nitrospinota bacterium]
MKNEYDYDLIVIGGGAGGFTGAKLAAGLGKKVLMLNKGKLGGECTWFGCVPSKALLQCAKYAHSVKSIGKFGLKLPNGDTLNVDGVPNIVKGAVNQVYQTHLPGDFERLGIRVYEDVEGSFVDANTVQFKEKMVTGDKFLIATGSSPQIIPVKGIEDVDYLTNDNVFEMDKLPASMIVLGGGPIAIELASAYNRLGVKVTIIQRSDRILVKEEKELAIKMAEILTGEGVEVITGTKLLEVKKENGITVYYEQNGEGKSVAAEKLLVATGRTPNIESLNLNKAGIEYDKKGIKCDDYMRTTVHHIFAAGDVVGPYQFSHMAWHQAVKAVSNAFLPIKTKMNYNHVPWCTFTEPELARSGLTEEEARRTGKMIKVFRLDYGSIDRGRTDKTGEGIAKIVCDSNYHILGMHILGERAGEVMHELHLAKTHGIPLHKLKDTIHAYPCYNDLVAGLAKQAYIDKINENPIINFIKLFRG